MHRPIGISAFPGTLRLIRRIRASEDEFYAPNAAACAALHSSSLLVIAHRRGDHYRYGRSGISAGFRMNFTAGYRAESAAMASSSPDYIIPRYLITLF